MIKAHDITGNPDTIGMKNKARVTVGADSKQIIQIDDLILAYLWKSKKPIYRYLPIQKSPAEGFKWNSEWVEVEEGFGDLKVLWVKE